MKQIFIIIAVLMMIASPENVGAQWNNDLELNHSKSTVKRNAKSPDKKKFSARAAGVDAHALKDFMNSNRILAEIKITHVNIKAVRHFIGSHKNISDAKWFETEGGYLASFISKRIFTKIVYDDKGRWMYNLLEYTEADLAFEIRDMVKRKYYDDDIFVVHQYEFDNNKTIYIIRMYDQQSSIRTIKVCDGEIEDITQLEKN